MNLICPLTRIANLTGSTLRFVDNDNSIRELQAADWLKIPSVSSGCPGETRPLSIASVPVVVITGGLQVRDLPEPRDDHFLVVNPIVALLGSLDDSRWDLLCPDESTAIRREGAVAYTQLIAFDASGVAKPHPFARARL